MTQSTVDLIVIGAGPGGYMAAIKAAQLGMKVAIIDKTPLPGGTCLNVGCIPSKVLLGSSLKYRDAQHHFEELGIYIDSIELNLSKMMANKEKVMNDLAKGIHFLFKKNKVIFVQGKAEFQDPKVLKVTLDSGESQVLQAEKIIIATGSEPSLPPHIAIDGRKILSSTDALSLIKVPHHLVVIGGGYIGLELGSVWSRLGAKVTVVEAADRLLPLMDHEVAKTLYHALMTQGITFHLSTLLKEIIPLEKGVEVTLAPSPEGRLETLLCDQVLIATGRIPLTKNLNLEKIGVTVDKRGFIPVDARFQTACEGVYAIGDVIDSGPMLAHRAEEEGVALACLLAGKYGHVRYETIPSIIYTSPEIASVGFTEEQLKMKKIDYRVGKSPFTANARARTLNETIGFVKVLTHRTTDQILGVHSVGDHASHLIAEATLGMEFSASAEDIARTCHAHPTFSEALKEAAKAAYDPPLT